MDIIPKQAWRKETMTIRHLRIFVTVYQKGNITQAAQELSMTQPAVSRSIKELESGYGVRLFDRIGHRIQPTELANRLYDQALHIVDAFDRMEHGVKDWDEEGLLRIGSSVTLGGFLLPELVSRFRLQYPSLVVKVRIANAETIKEGIFRNELDIGMVEGLADEPWLHAEPFSHDRLVPVLPPHDPLLENDMLHLEDFKDKPLLLREPGSAGRTFLDQVFAIHGMKIDPLWESTSTQALLQAVAHGIGVSFLPFQLAENAIEEGSVATRPLEGVSLERTHSLIWHKDKYLSASARQFIALCHTVTTR
jgi:DNA-binding transcriptional LysR family regulator